MCGLDTNWENSIKKLHNEIINKTQYYFNFLLTLLDSRLSTIRIFKKLSIDDSKIIFNFLSADLSIFESSFHKYKDKKEKHYPHRFLYVGRLSWQKSIPLLISAWKDIQEKKIQIGN